MKVTVDLDPQLVWNIQTEAEARGITAGAVLRERVARRSLDMEYRDRVRSRVLAGMCDADIAAELRRQVNDVAAVRRQLQLPPNRRYAKKAPRATTERKTA